MGICSGDEIPANVSLSDGDTKPKIGFIGCGKMAQAMVNGFLSSGILKAQQITVSACHESTFAELKKIGVHGTLNNVEVVQQSHIVIVAVKPHVVQTVLQEVASHVTTDHIVISIAVGLSVAFLEKFLPAQSRVLRCTPNTPCLMLSGVILLMKGTQANDEDVKLVKSLFASVGICEVVASEALLDAAGGLSGCGPAYMYTLLEAMADGGVKMGIPRDMSIRLAAQTMLGAAKMVLHSGKHSAQLKDEVCSPGGSTICGIHALEQHGARNALISAVEAGVMKAREIRDANK